MDRPAARSSFHPNWSAFWRNAAEPTNRHHVLELGIRRGPVFRLPFAPAALLAIPGALLQPVVERLHERGRVGHLRRLRLHVRSVPRWRHRRLAKRPAPRHVRRANHHDRRLVLERDDRGATQQRADHFTTGTRAAVATRRRHSATRGSSPASPRSPFTATASVKLRPPVGWSIPGTSRTGWTRTCTRRRSGSPQTAPLLNAIHTEALGRSQWGDGAFVFASDPSGLGVRVGALRRPAFRRLLGPGPREHPHRPGDDFGVGIATTNPLELAFYLARIGGDGDLYTATLVPAGRTATHPWGFYSFFGDAGRPATTSFVPNTPAVAFFPPQPSRLLRPRGRRPALDQNERELRLAR